MASLASKDFCVQVLDAVKCALLMLQMDSNIFFVKLLWVNTESELYGWCLHMYLLRVCNDSLRQISKHLGVLPLFPF